jgi:6-phosphogluconolactonase
MTEKPDKPALPQIGRRQFIAAGAAGATMIALPTIAVPTLAAGETKQTFVYVGSYTKNPPGGGSGNPVGLSVFRFDPDNGALTPVQQVPSANPSFVALDPSQRFLYVVNEINDYEGQPSGSAEAYAIDPSSGKITLLNRQSVKGATPAHLTVDPTGRYLIVANYVGGNFVVLPIAADGRLGPVTGEIANAGRGPHERQTMPHPHMVTFDPAGRFIATADLGIDQLHILRLTDGGLTRISQAAVAAGAGPRHVAFNPSGRLLYVLNELNATVTAFAYDAANGHIGNELQTIPTEPPGYHGRQSTAEIAVHPSGKFVYVSNRGHNSIVGYRIDPVTGLLSVIGHATDGVAFPRNFAIDPSGTRLYVANQTADTIVEFRIDTSTGELKPTGQVTPSITPVAVVFRTAG